jgi:protein ImuA
MGQLLWVLRPAHARQQASPAPLRLWVQCDAGAPLAMQVQVQVLKRRGPPLTQPVVLPGGSARLAQVLAAAAARSQQRRGQGLPVQAAAPLKVPLEMPVPGNAAVGWKGVVHALDRVAVPAAA